jgi:hypothetical protein
MTNKKNPATVRTGKIKKSLCVGLLMVFFVNLFLFVPRSSYATVETGSFRDTMATIGNDMKVWWKENWAKIQTNFYDETGSGALLQAFTSFTQQMAQKVATAIATGAKGGKPLANLDTWDKWGQLSKDAGDSAAGTFIEGLTKGTGFEDICTPDLDLKLKFSLALFKLKEPEKPKCTLSEMGKNWDTAINDPNLLKNFSATFDTKQNDFGIFLDLNDKIAKKEQESREGEKNKKNVEDIVGAKPVTEAISGNVITPAVDIVVTSNINKLLNGLSPFLIDIPIVANAKPENKWKLAINSIATTFTKTLWNEMAKDLFKGKFTAQDGVDYWNKFCDQNPHICNEARGLVGRTDLVDENGNSITNTISNGTTTNSLKNSNAQEQTLSKATAELKYKKFVSVTGTEASNYDVLPSFTNCPKEKNRKPGPNNCIIDNNFATAISTKMTLKEAIAQGKINGDQIFGFDKNGTLTNENGLPYRSVLVLRKYRIIPVGWELASEYIRDFETKNQTLNSLIAVFDDTTSPYYQFVDPNWVLKIPSLKCESLGFGPELLSETTTPGIDMNKNGDWNDPDDLFPAKSVVRNDQYCAKEQTCIKEKADGTCEFYGNCMEEKRTFKIDGEACDSTYNTCQTFKAPNGTNVSYLKNTLNWSDCDANNAGCLDLCNNFNPAENDVLTANMVGYWKLDNFTAGKPVLDSSTGKQNNGTLKDQYTTDADPKTVAIISTAEGKIGNSFSFDGVNDYIEIPDSSSLNFGDGIKDSPFSISAWIKTDDNTKYQHIVSKYLDTNNQYNLSLLSTKNLAFAIQNGSNYLGINTTTNFLQANQWYYVVATYDGNSKTSGLNLYVNGIKQTNITLSGNQPYIAMKPTTEPVRIGTANVGGVLSNFFVGKIDDVAIYNKALTEKEVYNKNMSYDCLRKDEKIYLSGQAKTCDQTEAGCGGYLEANPNLVAFWQFEEGKGTKIYDSSGNRNEGLLNESKWTEGERSISLEFDGINDYLTIPHKNTLAPNTDSFSMELWVKPFTNTNAGHQRFIWKDNGDGGVNHRGYYISNISGTFMGELADNAGVSTSFSFGKHTTADWHHLVLVRDKKTNKVKTYLNGSFVEEVDDKTRDVDFNSDFIIGGRNDLAEMFNGAIDEVAIYNNAISEQEIQDHYSNGINFNAKNIKVANTNLHCFGRTTGDAMFDLPADVNNCISLGDRFDTNLAEGGCFEYLHHKTKDYCEKNLGTWLSSPIKVTKHTAQSYCENSGGVWKDNGTPAVTTDDYCATQCLKIDEPECSKYAFNCKAVENGCEKYTPTAGGTPIPGVATEDDQCPAECAGYDTYKQEATNFESSDFPVYFIPETAKDCSSAVAGCDEFTNVDSSKENREYYSYMRQCEPIPTAAATYQCGTFYTWIDAGSKGFQLQANFLKSSGAGAGENPVEILRIEEDLGDCEDANDALTNENCKEFYNGEGVITYHLLKKTISCSNECTNYRKTEPAKFDLVQTCKNIGGTWDTTMATASCVINNQVACKNVNGAWDGSACNPVSITNIDFCQQDYYLNAKWIGAGSTCEKTDYKAVPTEGLTCSANEKGCREYTGNTGGNIMTVFNDNFESDKFIYDYPNSGNGWTGGTLSSVSTVQGQQSIKVNDGVGKLIEKWLSAKCTLASTCLQSGGCECKESDLDGIYLDNDTTATDDKVCTVDVDQTSCDIANYTYDKGTYLLSFWAKGNLDDHINAYFKDISATPKDLHLGTVVLTEDWKYYVLGPITLDLAGWSEYYKLELSNIDSNGGTDPTKFSAYIDNVKLEAVTDSIFKIKNSWKTPASCDRDPNGNPYLYYMLGCDEYTNSQGDISYLKSFTNVCRDEAVGCKQYIDTQNSSAPYEQTWNAGDASKITVPADALVYLAPKESDSCLVKGCSLVGQSNYNQDRTIVNSIKSSYRVNDPDLYDTSLCLKKDVGCQSYLAGDFEYYFRDPQDAVCEYVTPTGKTEVGWYKKEADKIYDANSEKCPLSTYQNLGIERPTSNWAGACPTTQSSCTALVDPLSDFSTENVRNSSFIKNLDKTTTTQDGNGDGTNDGTPDDWSGIPTIYNSSKGYVRVNSTPLKYASSIDLNPNSTYVLSAEIQDANSSLADAVVTITCKNFDQSNSACPSVDDEGLYTIDKTGETQNTCGNPIANEITMIIPNKEIIKAPITTKQTERFSTSFAPGSCNRIGLEIQAKHPLDPTQVQTFWSVSIKEAGVYYYLNSSLADAKSECNGLVNFDNGCVLLNNRDNARINRNDYTSHLTYNTNTNASTPTNCSKTDGTSFGCNADTLIKVRPDRDCAKWLYCNSTETIDEKELCTDIGLCDTMNSNGTCIHSPLDYSDQGVFGNMNFDQGNVDKLKNLSGYSNVGYDWGGTKKIEGSLSPAQMKVYGEDPGLVNGNFEQTISVPTVSYTTGTCSWDPSKTCDPADAPAEINSPLPAICVGDGNVCNNKITYETKPTGWTANGPDNSYVGVINNPVHAQKENISIFEGSNVLFVKAGSSSGQGHAKSSTFSLSAGVTYVVTGYINTKKLSSSDSNAYASITLVLLCSSTPCDNPAKSIKIGKDWTMVQFNYSPTSNMSGYLMLGDNSSGPCSNCSGTAYFDNISIKPSLNTQTTPAPIFYSAPSCRLFPRSEALSCEFIDPENTSEEKGTLGYCLESDPQFPEYCLNWFPVDTISSDESVLETVKYAGPAPLYYCLEEKRSIDCAYNDATNSFETKKPITYCNKIVKTVDDSGENKYWSDRIKVGSNYIVDAGGLNYNFTTGGGSTGDGSYGAFTKTSDPATWGKYTDSYSPYSCSTINPSGPSTTTTCPSDSSRNITNGIINNPPSSSPTNILSASSPMTLQEDYSTTISGNCSIVEEIVSGKPQAKCSVTDDDTYTIKVAMGGSPINTVAASGIFPVKYQTCAVETGCGMITTNYETVQYNPAIPIPSSCDDVTVKCTRPLNNDFAVDENAINKCGPSATDPIAEVQRLFAKSYGVWNWDETTSKYNNIPPSTSPNWTIPATTPTCASDRTTPSQPSAFCTDAPDITGILINDVNASTTQEVISNKDFSLKFNSNVNNDQLPMVEYSVDWGDNSSTNKTGISTKDSSTTPHTFKRRYDIDTLLNLDAQTPSSPTISCTAPNECLVDITIEIKDNWNKAGSSMITVKVKRTL